MEDLGAPTPLTKIDIDQSIKGSKVDYKQYFEYVQGDISKMKADVIVNSIPPGMYSTFGVCKSIHDKSGPNLLKYLKKNYHSVLPGGFVDSPGFKLGCKSIIHVSGPLKEESDLLKSLYQQCLYYCFSHDYHSIIFPCISTGGRGFEEEEACIIAINTCRLWVDKYGSYWKGKITFCCYTDKSFSAYKKFFSEILNL